MVMLVAVHILNWTETTKIIQAQGMILAAGHHSPVTKANARNRLGVTSDSSLAFASAWIPNLDNSIVGTGNQS